jgi:hypothetical protein
MPDFAQSIAQHQHLSEAQQKHAGQPVAGSMGDEHSHFLQTIIGMIDRGEISSDDPQSLLNRSVYDGLPQEWKDKADLELLNITEQLTLIEQFYRDTKTPDSSPQLQTMIEALWQMKQRIEDHYDVFKF